MTVLNDLLRPIFDWLQRPLEGLPPIVGVLIWSIPVGVFALWVFGKTSNQERIAQVKRRIHAGLFEIRLFNDDLRAIMRAQGEILRHVVHYQALALKPMIFILPPLVLVMVQLHQFYGFSGLRPGAATQLTVALDPDAVKPGLRPEVSLDLPPGLRAETEAIWAPALAEFSWRLAADESGEYDIQIVIDGVPYSKNVAVVDKVKRLSPERPSRGFVDQLEWPSEAPLEMETAVRSISVVYPEATMDLLGWSWQWSFAWMVVFFVLTMVVALVLRKPMGVEL